MASNTPTHGIPPLSVLKNRDAPESSETRQDTDRANARRPSSANGAAGLSQALGWLSVGLGLAQIAAPRRVARLAGMADAQDTEALMRAMGLREIATGAGILMRSNPAPWLWARVGGDALDLALLNSAKASQHADHQRLAAATAAVVGITAADAYCGTRLALASRLGSADTVEPQPVQAMATITVNAPIAQIYQAWDGFQALPRFMASAATVEVAGERQSQWTANVPGGLSLEWDILITESIPHERIAWRTTADSFLTADGDIRFRPAPGDQGTEVRVDARFSPPGGELGRKIGDLFADAIGTKLQQDLRRFKQLMEIGEIVMSDDSIVKGPNAAQPVASSAAA